MSWRPWPGERRTSSPACPRGSWTRRRRCWAGPAMRCCSTAGPAPRRRSRSTRPLVIDTRIRHALGDGRYAERRRACEAGASALGVRSLRDVTEDGELARLGDPALRRICGHVLAEQRRVLRAAELPPAGGREQLTAVGALLTVLHDSLRDQFGVSWPQADEAVAAAVDAGAAGARMTGGGFGGCVVAVVPATRVEHVRGAVTERFARHRWPAPRYLDAVPSDGGRRLRWPRADPRPLLDILPVLKGRDSRSNSCGVLGGSRRAGVGLCLARAYAPWSRGLRRDRQKASPRARSLRARWRPRGLHGRRQRTGTPLGSRG